MKGRIIAPRTSDAASTDSPDAIPSRSKPRTTVRRPRKPYTTDGIPARTSITGRTTARVRGPATQSASAAPTPTGSATTSAPNDTASVPAIIGRIPRMGFGSVGSQSLPERKPHSDACDSAGRLSFSSASATNRKSAAAPLASQVTEAAATDSNRREVTISRGRTPCRTRSSCPRATAARRRTPFPARSVRPS